MSMSYEPEMETEELNEPLETPEELGLEADSEELSPEAPVGEVAEEQLDDAELGKHLLDILRDVENEESTYRTSQLQFLRKLDLFWHGIQRLYWSENSKEFLSVNDIEDPEIREQVEALDEVVNIYKAHGEAVIAALSTGIPNVRFFPEDADSAVDILAAKSHSKVAELLTRRIKAPILFIQALFTLWNQNFVAAYHYSQTDERFGTFEKTEFDTQEIQVPSFLCTSCGLEIPEFQPVCPKCGATESFDQEMKTQVIQTPKVIRLPKSSQVVEIYGPLNVLIQNNARKVRDTGVLVLYTENDIAKVIETYPEWAEKITGTVDSETEDSQVRATHNSFFPENHELSNKSGSVLGCSGGLEFRIRKS